MAGVSISRFPTCRCAQRARRRARGRVQEVERLQDGHRHRTDTDILTLRIAAEIEKRRKHKRTSSLASSARFVDVNRPRETRDGETGCAGRMVRGEGLHVLRVSQKSSEQRQAEISGVRGAGGRSPGRIAIFHLPRPSVLACRRRRIPSKGIQNAKPLISLRKFSSAIFAHIPKTQPNTQKIGTQKAT